MTVFVLWEDKAVSPVKRFGPHAFLVACVASRLGIDRHRLMRSGVIQGKPCGGNGNVLRELKNEPLYASTMFVVAVLDTDEIHDRLPGISSRRMVTDAKYAVWLDSACDGVRKHAPEAGQAQLEVCFLDQNLETLLSLVGHGMPELSAARGKDVMARERILHRAAADEALVHKACAQMPSWDVLVTTVARLIRSDMTVIADGLLGDT